MRAVTSGLSSLGMPTHTTVRPPSASSVHHRPRPVGVLGDPGVLLRHRVVPLARVRAVGVGQPLAVVAAERDDDDLRLLGGQRLGEVRRPVEEVGTGQARRHLVVDRRRRHPGRVEQLLRYGPNVPASLSPTTSTLAGFSAEGGTTGGAVGAGVVGGAVGAWAPVDVVATMASGTPVDVGSEALDGVVVSGPEPSRRRSRRHRCRAGRWP